MNKTELKKLAHEITSTLAVATLILASFGTGIFTTKAAALTDSIVSYYKFDESSGSAADSAGANTGTVSATMTYGATGKIGTAYTLDGNDYVSINGVTTNTTNISVSVWVKSTVASNYLSILDSYSGTRLMFHWSRNGQSDFLGYMDGATIGASNKAPPNDGNWHHIVWVITGTTGYVYLDGSQSAQITGMAARNIGTQTAIGAGYDMTAWFWSGTIDEVGIWNRALSSAEVTTLYGSGNGLAYPFVTVPVVTTQAVSGIGTSTSTANGNITDIGGSSPTTRGFKYGLTETDTWTVSESGTYGAGAYTGSLTGLSLGTTYYVRAFATNAQGTGYGSYVSFTALANAPTVSTTGTSGTNATSTTATGNITATGGANATTRGFKYGLAQEDTWTVSQNGSYGTGEYSLSVTGLSAGVTYYIRAFATNSVGTSYGSYLSFTTSESSDLIFGEDVILGSDVIFR